MSFKFTDAQVADIKSDDASTAIKATKAIIKSAQTAYAKLSDRLHWSACAAGYMASQHGNTDALNTMFQWLKPNDRLALKNWLVDAATFTFNPEEGESENVCWLVAKTDNKVPVVSVKKKTKKIDFASVRQEMSFEDWLSLGNFTERDNVADEDMKGYNLFEAIKREVTKSDKIASGDSDKFYFEETDQVAMLNVILHAAVSDGNGLSKLYAAIRPAKGEGKSEREQAVKDGQKFKKESEATS